MCSDIPKVRWVMLYGFVANFIGFPAVQKFWKSVKTWQSYREFTGGPFFETQCTAVWIASYSDGCKNSCWKWVCYMLRCWTGNKKDVNTRTEMHRQESYWNDKKKTVTVTVTEALVLRPLLEDQGRITESIRILVPVDKIKQNCFQITITTKRDDMKTKKCNTPY